MISDDKKDEFKYVHTQQHGYSNMVGTEPVYYTNYMQYSSQAPVAPSASEQIAYISCDVGTFEHHHRYGLGFHPALNFGYTTTGDYTGSWTVNGTTLINPKHIYDEYYPLQINNNTIVNPQDAHIANEHLNKLENSISNLNIGGNMAQTNDESQNEILDNDKNSGKDKNNNNTSSTNGTNNTSIRVPSSTEVVTSNENTMINANNSNSTSPSSAKSNLSSNNASSNNILNNGNVYHKMSYNNGNHKYKPSNHNNNLYNSNNNNNSINNTNPNTIINNNNSNNTTNNNNNNKSWASVCSQSNSGTVSSNKKSCTQNQNVLPNNNSNIIATYAVASPTMISPNRHQNIDAQYMNNHNKHSHAFNNQLVNGHYNYSNYYRQQNYYYNPQNGYYNQNHYSSSGRNRGQSFNQNSKYHHINRRNYNNNNNINSNNNTNNNTITNNQNNSNNTGITQTISNNNLINDTSAIMTTATTTSTTTTITNNSNMSNDNLNGNNNSNNNNNNNDNTNNDNSTNSDNVNLNSNTINSNVSNSSPITSSMMESNLDVAKNENFDDDNNNMNNPNCNSNMQQQKHFSNDKTNAILTKLKLQNQYNPKDFNLSPKGARFFVIKSYSEDDVHRSIKYNIWCSTEHGNRRLDQAFREREGKGPVYLFFSVNGSGHFCGMAEMMSCVDYDSKSDVWSQDKWKGKFEVKWIYVKDVPNSQLRNIRLENNENKPVTNSRDTQEIPSEKGKQVLKVFHHYRNNTSIFDDFEHYERRQDEDHKKPVVSVIL